MDALYVISRRAARLAQYEAALQSMLLRLPNGAESDAVIGAIALLQREQDECNAAVREVA